MTPIPSGADAAYNAHHIYSGDYHVTNKKNVYIVTILGSCVAACIRDPIAGVGGMNHFLLPGKDEGAASESARYGAFAMEKLINELLKAGGRRERLEVKVFGGSDLIDSAMAIGTANATFVLEYLRKEGMKPLVKDLGGKQPRRLHYYPLDGKVMMRKIGGEDDRLIKTLTSRETAYRNTIVKERHDGGDPELF
ncbi:MAG: hypothetical protein ABW189_07025 [Rickettsiales bacterium]